MSESTRRADQSHRPHPLRAKLASGHFPVGLEITTPRQLSPTILLRRAQALDGASDSVHVVQRPDRQASLDASAMLADLGIDAVWHLVNRGRSRRAIREDLTRAALRDIRALVCMRGDHIASDLADTPSLSETVRMARTALPEALIGATANQYGERSRVLPNLLAKLRQGADFVLFQPAFIMADYERLAREIRSRSHSTYLLPTLMPVLSSDAAVRIEKRLRIRLPSSLHRDLRAGGEEAGWDHFEAALRTLAEGPWADGCAIATSLADPPRYIMDRIRVVIGSCRPT